VGRLLTPAAVAAAAAATLHVSNDGRILRALGEEEAAAPRPRTLGHFATKVEAAVCYAKWVEEQERCEQP